MEKKRTRQELYKVIKNTKMESVVQYIFKKNYTNCSNAELEFFITTPILKLADLISSKSEEKIDKNKIKNNH